MHEKGEPRLSSQTGLIVKTQNKSTYQKHSRSLKIKTIDAIQNKSYP